MGQIIVQNQTFPSKICKIEKMNKTCLKSWHKCDNLELTSVLIPEKGRQVWHTGETYKAARPGALRAPVNVGSRLQTLVALISLCHFYPFKTSTVLAAIIATIFLHFPSVLIMIIQQNLASVSKKKKTLWKYRNKGKQGENLQTFPFPGLGDSCPWVDH